MFSFSTKVSVPLLPPDTGSVRKQTATTTQATMAAKITQKAGFLYCKTALMRLLTPSSPKATGQASTIRRP